MRGKLTISLGTIQENYRFLADKVRSAICAAVVKADAYGLGVEPVAKALAQSGAQDFFVALLEEGIALRRFLSSARIYILNGFMLGEESVLFANDLIPVLNDLAALKIWQSYARSRGKPLPAVLHIDTGLNRLGFNLADFEKAAADLNGLDVLYVMSHLACADERGHPMNELQRQRFQQALKATPNAKASLAASDGVFCGPEFHFDLVRPGAALYGVNPTPGQANPMQACVKLAVPILQIREVAENGIAGYGATEQVAKGQRLATVALGYADGFPRLLSSKGKLFYKRSALPVVGRVSMDVAIVDISALPESALKPGDFLEVLGPDQRLDQLAGDMGTIGYEVLTSLGRRFDRHYEP